MAAAIIGIADRYGIRPGAAADLVVLSTIASPMPYSTARTAAMSSNRAG